MDTGDRTAYRGSGLRLWGRDACRGSPRQYDDPALCNPSATAGVREIRRT